MSIALGDKAKLCVGKRIKELRVLKGFSKSDVGRILGVTERGISCYEEGEFFPHESVLVGLMEVFRCDANYLFQDFITHKNASDVITEGEYEMIKAYRELDVYGKKNVMDILRNEAMRRSV